MEEMDTDYFCEFLRQNGIKDSVIAVFREEEISGSVFPHLTKEDLEYMDLKMGDRKLLLQLQEKHVPEKTLVSHAHHGYYHYWCCLRQECGLSYLHGPTYTPILCSPYQ